VEIKVYAPQFKDGDALDVVVSRAADIIYADFQKGGPCVAGNTAERCLSLLTFVGEETPEAWLPQLQVPINAVQGPVESVMVGALVEDDDQKNRQQSTTNQSSDGREMTRQSSGVNN
jgi:hypothetical protein